MKQMGTGSINDGGDHVVRPVLIAEQDKALLDTVFMGKPICAMDREELKGLVCWMLKRPALVDVLRRAGGQ